MEGFALVTIVRSIATLLDGRIQSDDGVRSGPALRDDRLEMKPRRPQCGGIALGARPLGRSCVESDRTSEKHRADHYRFLIANRNAILFGGLARVSEGGPPETMIIIVDTPTVADAEHFIANAPYNNAGGFSLVRVRPWSQVLPEDAPGALERFLASL